MARLQVPKDVHSIFKPLPTVLISLQRIKSLVQELKETLPGARKAEADKMLETVEGEERTLDAETAEL